MLYSFYLYYYISFFNSIIVSSSGLADTFYLRSPRTEKYIWRNSASHLTAKVELFVQTCQIDAYFWHPLLDYKFSFGIHYSSTRKLRESPVGHYYLICVLIANKNTCLIVGGVTTQLLYFNCPPPALAQYFNCQAFNLTRLNCLKMPLPFKTAERIPMH